MSIVINNLNMHFDELTLFKNFSIKFSEGTISCILGPSGCGKTTLLNIIGGLLKPQNGNVLGIDKKSISYIFQEPRLLPWRTVQQNIELVLANAYDEPKRQQVAQKFIDLVELNGFENYYPSQLSGGMLQRVSIARAFAYPSDLILMDEPLKGLDVKLKLNLINAFARIWQVDKRTVLFVTHDVDEALMLGNDIVVFSKAPINVITTKSIDESPVKRNLGSQEYFELKNQLLKVLND
ncbi:MAG TPA: ABC transporter ATP-binding protein [Tenuifilaceae bacterium]|nr:ABC transporter ATP-binding protein [Tenuifilaceae bacterium]